MTTQTVVITAVSLPLLLAAVLAAMIIFGTAAPPQPDAAIGKALAQLDLGDLPPLETLPARDGTALAYRSYPAGGDRLAVLVHGSAGAGFSMHALAKALQAAGVSSFALDMRGHGASGTAGDIAYVGQLDDDLGDVAQQIRRDHPGGKIALVGFSSGAGYVLRLAGGTGGGLFDSYVLISPYLGHRAPTQRPEGGGWIVPFVPRLIALAILDRLGLHRFEGLPVVALAPPPGGDKDPVAAYSYRLARNFTPSDDYREDLRHVARPLSVVVGGEDEVFYADRFAPTIHAIRTDIAVQMVPGLGHVAVTVNQAGAQAIAKAVVDGLAARTGASE